MVNRIWRLFYFLKVMPLIMKCKKRWVEGTLKKLSLWNWVAIACSFNEGIWRGTLLNRIHLIWVFFQFYFSCSTKYFLKVNHIETFRWHRFIYKTEMPWLQGKIWLVSGILETHKRLTPHSESNGGRKRQQYKSNNGWRKRYGVCVKFPFVNLRYW